MALFSNPAVPAILSVCAASITMTVVNKFIVSGRDFTMNFLLIAVQSIVCIGAVSLAKKLGVISFRDFDLQEAYRWSPVSAMLVVVLYTGSKSLQYLSIPVYTIFKNLTIILTAYGEVIWFGGAVTKYELISFFLMVCSSLIAASANLSAYFFPPTSAAELALAHVGNNSNVGYFWVLLNCFATAGYILSMRKRIKVTNFKDWDTMFYNNLLSIPILLFASLVLEGWTSTNFAKNFPEESRSFLITAICFSGGAAVLISYATAWCIRVTSSTTYSMIGALNKLPVAVSGMVFFGDPINVRSVSAVSLGFAAGLMYTEAKKSSNAAKAREAAGYLPAATADTNDSEFPLKEVVSAGPSPPALEDGISTDVNGSGSARAHFLGDEALSPNPKGGEHAFRPLGGKPNKQS